MKKQDKIMIAVIILLLSFLTYKGTQKGYYAVYEGPEHVLYHSFSHSPQKGYAKLIKQIEKDGYNPEHFTYKKR